VATCRLAIKQASQAGKPQLAGLKLFAPEAGLLGLLEGLLNFVGVLE